MTAKPTLFATKGNNMRAIFSALLVVAWFFVALRFTETPQPEITDIDAATFYLDDIGPATDSEVGCIDDCLDPA